jgi:hypothetical protein
MKKNLFIYALIALTLTLFSSCEKEEYNTYENPHWAVTSYEGLSASCTIVMDLPNNIKPYQDEDDVVAAFINGECRGVSTQQNGLFYIIVSAAADEVANIDLKYYNVSNKYMYQVAEQIPFEINKRIGTTDDPFIPTCIIL